MYIGEQTHGKSSTPSPRLAMQAYLILVMSIHTSHGSSIDRILQELITSLRRQQIRRYGQPCSCKKSNSRANSADIPRHVEIPTRNGKLFVMIKQVCLDAVSAICDDDLKRGKRETERVQLTTIEITANSTTDTRVSMPATNGQPVSRLYLPPFMTTRKETRLARHIMAASEAMNPTVFHISQKYRSPAWHNSAVGNSLHVGLLRFEHVLCRPMCFSTTSPLGVVTE